MCRVIREYSETYWTPQCTKTEFYVGLYFDQPPKAEMLAQYKASLYSTVTP